MFRGMPAAPKSRPVEQSAKLYEQDGEHRNLLSGKILQELCVCISRSVDNRRNHRFGQARKYSCIVYTERSRPLVRTGPIDGDKAFA